MDWRERLSQAGELDLLIRELQLAENPLMGASRSFPELSIEQIRRRIAELARLLEIPQQPFREAR